MKESIKLKIIKVLISIWFNIILRFAVFYLMPIPLINSNLPNLRV